jgi:hypothetical protein
MHFLPTLIRRPAPPLSRRMVFFDASARMEGLRPASPLRVPPEAAEKRQRSARARDEDREQHFIRSSLFVAVHVNVTNRE